MKSAPILLINTRSTKGFAINPILGCCYVLVILALLWVQPSWALAGLGVFAALVAGLLLLATGRDFEYCLLGLFFIGYFQGYASKLLNDSLPQSIWGLLKYALLAFMVIGYVAKLFQGQPIKMHWTMRLWLGTWLTFWVITDFLMLEAYFVDSRYRPIGTIQQLGIVNMVLALLIYLRARPVHIDKWFRIIIGAGILAAIFGIVQRILGPARLSLFGISQDALLASLAFLPINNPETGFLDIRSGLRAFSFFDTHHAFSGFLVLSILALQMQWLCRRIKPLYYWSSMFILWAGMAVTFNLTNILTCGLALFIFSVLQRGGRLGAIFRLAKSRRFLQITVSIAFIGFLAIAAYAPLRNRVVGIFDIRQGAAGAGGSLAYRLEGLTSGLQAMLDYPFGFGLFLNATYSIQSNTELNRYARVNGYFAERGIFFSGDNWFQWLMVQVGLPAFLLYALLFLIPIFWGWRWRNRILDHDWRIILQGLLALVITVFIAGVSNSPILAFPPTNLLFWGIVGLLLKIPVWAQKAF